MRITCPQCHARCRLKSDNEINDSSQGKCPECDHIFIIPPGVNREKAATDDRSDKQKKAGFKPDFKIAGIKKIIALTPPSRKTSLFLVFSGLSLTILLTALFFGPREASSPRPRPGQEIASTTTSPTPKPAKLSLTPQARAKAIAQIKHHALVGDADITIKNNQLQLALLVSGNTPVTYAERLGRQFAHYLKEQLTETHKQSREPPIKISVYYPGGTRIEVATNGQSGEEEVLPE